MTQEALKLALEALERSVATCFDQYAHQQVMSHPDHFINQAITAIKEALAQPEQILPSVYSNTHQPEQEPVAWATQMGEYAHIKWGAKRPEYPMVYEIPLYTTPPQREPKPFFTEANGFPQGFVPKDRHKVEQEPMAMKFKIYKPTVPDPTRQDINNALLPWVYDQDRSSGFDASMWVTPVSTLPPQRTWVGLTDDEQQQAYEQWQNDGWGVFYNAIEAKLKEKNS